jgi:sulfite reductase (ferredoxin)
MTETAPVKETKAQKIERLKREKNPWEAFNEVREFARQGRTSVVPEWASAYFKWWGVYTQGDGVGAVGGKGGEGLASEYFMMRIGIPNGIIRADQLRLIADITRKHARNLADITVRQNIQLHWLTIESLPEIVDALDAIGLSPKGACGDVVRNVTGCPLAGIAHDEILDASPLAVAVAHELTANPDFYNLPRKFKISISGCSVWCNYPEINDVALTGVRRGDEVGYSLRVGGGLSNEPHLGVRLDAFIRPEQALDVVRRVAEIFRDQQGLRESRDRARLKYLFMREGWTAESFLRELETRTGDQLAAAAELAERLGSGELRATIMQNLIFINVPTENAGELAGEIEKIGLRVEGSTFWRGAIACTGTEFCKLAITETKGFARWLVEELEERIPQFDEQLKLHVTGCPNSCGQHWIADIGLEGKKIKHEGKMVDAYYFCVGGAVGRYAAVARPVGYRVPATEVPAALERLLRTYLSERQPEENLRTYFGRHSADEIRDRLSGVPVEAVERDVPAGRVPHGVAE